MDWFVLHFVPKTSVLKYKYIYIYMHPRLLSERRRLTPECVDAQQRGFGAKWPPSLPLGVTPTRTNYYISARIASSDNDISETERLRSACGIISDVSEKSKANEAKLMSADGQDGDWIKGPTFCPFTDHCSSPQSPVEQPVVINHPKKKKKKTPL